MKILRLKLFLIVSILGVISLACATNAPNTNLVATNISSSAEPAVVPKAGAVEKVTFESADKTVIVGSFFEAAKLGSPAVLLLHQFGSDRHSYDNFASQLQARGFGVLAIDGRGFGESVKTSDGKGVGVSRTNDAVKGMTGDVSGAFDFLTKQKNVDPARISIVGASYGSSLALIYAAENLKVRSIVLLSPGLNYFGNMPTEPAVKKYGDRPMLMIAADDDKESSDSIKKLRSVVANDKYETKIYPKGGHGTSLFEAKVGVEDIIEQFLLRGL